MSRVAARAQRPAGLAPRRLAELLATMQRIRAFDSILPRLYSAALTRGSSHAAIGQEAVAVGACEALEPGDLITSTHRGHGHALAKGADMGRMMAELLGREAGFCRGKGGSMHIADFAAGMLGANGIVGGGFGLAGGAALTLQQRGAGDVVVCFFGDGAINQGAFHEVANMAAIWRLPLVLLCENNQFAMSAVISQMTAVEDLAVRASSYGFPGVSVDGMDVPAVHAAVAQARARAAAGDGPTLVVAATYRFEGHFSGDLMKYRDAEEAARWRARDPIAALARQLVADGVIAEADVEAGRAAAEREVEEALEFAKASPLPDPSQAYEDLHA